MDAVQVQSYGIAPQDVLREFHNHAPQTLMEKFSRAEAIMFIANWNGEVAGTLAFDPFDHDAMEIHKFYVTPIFRGKRIGKSLMEKVLGELRRQHRRKVLSHTAPYMKDAIKLYSAFGFVECGRFRSTPEVLHPTDYFMALTI